MSRRALITGITGFIGGKLAARLLADGWHVEAIVRPTSNIADLPFTNQVTFHRLDDGQDLTPALAAGAPDIVFHLASLYLAEHRPDQVEDLIRSNVLLPVMLAQAMANTGIRRLINTGTAWQHFRGETYMPVNLYAATKQAAEDLLAYYTDVGALSVITLRLFDTYGEGDKRRKLVQILIDAACSGEALAMSPGEQIVDLTHVDDVIEGFMVAAGRLCGEEPPSSEAYLLSGERFSVKELSSVVADATGRSLFPAFGGRPYRAREVMVPIDAGAALPGWQRRHRLIEYIAMHSN
jgi:nucleoside-diphosphate-sugar epimerase